MDLSLRKTRKRSLEFGDKPRMKRRPAAPAAAARSPESLEPFSLASPAPFMQTTCPKALNDVTKKMDAFMQCVNQRLERMESMLDEVREKLKATRENELEVNRCVPEAVRRLHNVDYNKHKYDPQTSVSSPHNQGVTTHLLREVSLAMPCAKPEVIMASCKTYFETIRRSHRMNQDGNLQKKEGSRIYARMRQRKRRLYKARASVLQAGEEALWETATLDLMSEEEDTILEGRPVWVVRPPARSAELSALCATLQQRLDMDQKYVATHRQRVTSLQASGH